MFSPLFWISSSYIYIYNLSISSLEMTTNRGKSPPFASPQTQTQTLWLVPWSQAMSMATAPPSKLSHLQVFVISQWRITGKSMNHGELSMVYPWFIPWIYCWLVVSTPTEKYEFVNWDDETPSMWKNKTCSKPPTRKSMNHGELLTVSWWESIDIYDTKWWIIMDCFSGLLFQ